MRSIKWKLIAMYLGLVLIVMIVSGTYILLSLRNIEIDKSRQRLEIYAEKIQEQVIDDAMEETFQENLQKTVTNAMGIQGNILNSQGDTIATTTALQPPYTQYTDQAILSGSVIFFREKKYGFFWFAQRVAQLRHAGESRKRRSGVYCLYQIRCW